MLYRLTDEDNEESNDRHFPTPPNIAINESGWEKWRKACTIFMNQNPHIEFKSDGVHYHPADDGGIVMSVRGTSLSVKLDASEWEVSS
jgi:hypothetical protein